MVTTVYVEEVFESDITLFIKQVTGHEYTFKRVVERIDAESGRPVVNEENSGGFFTLVPVGKDGGFFEWYTKERKQHQCFKTMWKTAVYFVLYHDLWKTFKSPTRIPGVKAIDVNIFNDTTPMPFGKKKGEPLGSISDGYFMALYDAKKVHGPLKEYIEGRVLSLRVQKEKNQDNAEKKENS